MIDGLSRAITRYVAVSAALLLACGVGGATAQQPDEGEEQAPLVPLSEFLDLSVIAPSESTRALVEEVLAQSEDSGSAQYAQARQIEYLSLHEAINRALQKNLFIALRQKEIPFSEAVLLEAQAVFDPEFLLSVNYTRNNTSERFIVGTVFEKNFVPAAGGVSPAGGTGVPGQVIIPTNPNVTTPQVDEIRFNQVIGRGVVTKPVKVSSRPDNDAPHQTNYDFTVVQQLPWGPKLDITLNLRDKRIFYNTRANSYGANWTSSVAGNLFLPLPYTKDFGPYSPLDAGIKLAEQDTDRTYWELKQVINDTLARTDAVYWFVVAALEELRVIDLNRQLMQQQVDATNRLFEANRVTAFDKAQVDAELARLEVLAELARNSVIVAANALAELVTDSAEAIAPALLIPIDYADYLSRSLNLDGTDVFATGLALRPELQVAGVGIEQARIVTQAAEVATKPDFKLFASGSASENNEGDPAIPTDGFGYEGPEDALANVIDNPDAFSYSVTLAFVRPLGNRALEAAYERSQEVYADSALNLREQQNRVRREVGDTLSRVYTARERVALARKNVEFAELAFEKLIERRDKIGDVTAIEVVETSQTVLEARTELVRALVGHKRSEGELLAAQGIIANQYAQLLARNEFERNRLALLAAHDGLRFFEPIGE